MASVARYCCCGADECFPGSVACADCSADVSKVARFILTFSEVAICAGCTDFGGFSAETTWIAGGNENVNDVFTIDEDAVEGCYWNTIFRTLPELNLRTYTADGCNIGDLDTDDTSELFISLRLVSTTWTLVVSGPTSGEVFYAESPAIIGSDGKALCDQLPSFTNMHAIGDCYGNRGPGLPVILGYGGNATGVCSIA